MQYPKSTYEILAYKALNRDVDETWIDWALEMMEAGYDAESLVILAGVAKPYNQFYLQELTSMVLKDLSLDWSFEEKAIKDYALNLIDDCLKGDKNKYDVLNTLKDIYIETGYKEYLFDFYSLFFAMDDLKDSDVQWYWQGANKNNIDSIIRGYFLKWKSEASK